MVWPGWGATNTSGRESIRGPCALKQKYHLPSKCAVFCAFFFKKKIVFLLSKKFFFLKKIFLLSFTSNLLSFTTFYSVLPRLVLSFTKFPLSFAGAHWGHEGPTPTLLLRKQIYWIYRSRYTTLLQCALCSSHTSQHELASYQVSQSMAPIRHYVALLKYSVHAPMPLQQWVVPRLGSELYDDESSDDERLLQT